jgi:hypothetical protein
MFFFSEVIVQHVHTITRALCQHRANEFIRITDSAADGNSAATNFINFNRIGIKSEFINVGSITI